MVILLHKIKDNNFYDVHISFRKNIFGDSNLKTRNAKKTNLRKIVDTDIEKKKEERKENRTRKMSP